jgi:hypothetical protein
VRNYLECPLGAANCVTITSSPQLRPRRAALPQSRETDVDDNTMASSTFEACKREAVHLERQLEDKIARFQQVRNESGAMLAAG